MYIWINIFLLALIIKILILYCLRISKKIHTKLDLIDNKILQSIKRKIIDGQQYLLIQYNEWNRNRIRMIKKIVSMVS